MSKEERALMGSMGAEHVNKNYKFENYMSRWREILTEIHAKYGSWDTRTGYKTWHLNMV